MSGTIWGLEEFQTYGVWCCQDEEDAVDYEVSLENALRRLHDEGRYRTFIDIERTRGQFPHATWNKPDGTTAPVTVWCGNDYLGIILIFLLGSLVIFNSIYIIAYPIHKLPLTS